MSTKGGYVEILEFTHFSRVFRFNHTGEIEVHGEYQHYRQLNIRTKRKTACFLHFLWRAGGFLVS